MNRKFVTAALVLAWWVSPSRSQPSVEVTAAPADVPVAAPVEEVAPNLAPGGFGNAGGVNSMGGFGSMGGIGGMMTPINSYRVTWLPDQRVSGQNAKLGVVQQDLSASYPLWMSADGDRISARANVRSETFDTNAILPDSQRAFPNDLWNISLGLNGMFRFDNGWTAGGTVSVGSASDRPFDNSNTLNVSAMAFLRVPTGERDAWMFSLAYSPLGQLQFPIPGVAYSWNPTDEFSMNIGLPLSVRYRPTPDWMFEASYMLLTNIHTQVTYRLCEHAWVYGGYDWTNEGYYLTDMTQPTNGSTTQRFRYYEMRLNTGFRYALNPSCTIDLSGGYAFDRNYNQGSGFSLSGTDRVDVLPGPYISGQVRFRW